MAGKTTSALAQTQTVGSGTYYSGPSAPLLQGTGNTPSPAKYDPWSTTGRTGGTGGQGPSIIQNILSDYSGKAGSTSTGGNGGQGGGSVGNGGAGGTGGSPGNVQVILTSGVSIIITSSNNGSVVGLQASAISGNGGNGAGAGLSSGGPGGAGGSSVNQLATITLESGSSVSVTNQSKGSSAGDRCALSKHRRCWRQWR